MIQAKELIVIELDIQARFFKKTTLDEFNERRKSEFKTASFNPNLLLANVVETEKEAVDFIEFHKKNMDILIESICKQPEPFKI